MTELLQEVCYWAGETPTRFRGELDQVAMYEADTGTGTSLYSWGRSTLQKSPPVTRPKSWHPRV